MSRRVREMRARIGAHGKSSIFAMAITEFAAKCEPTPGLNAPENQPVAGNSPENRPGARESEEATMAENA
jgi:hypothetical protein